MAQVRNIVGPKSLNSSQHVPTLLMFHLLLLWIAHFSVDSLLLFYLLVLFLHIQMIFSTLTSRPRRHMNNLKNGYNSSYDIFTASPLKDTDISVRL